MTIQKNAAGKAVQAEPCQKSARTEALDRMFALQSIAQGLATGLHAYQELVRIEQHHSTLTTYGEVPPPECLKPRCEFTEHYRLEDLADAFANLVQQQGDALHVIGAAA